MDLSKIVNSEQLYTLELLHPTTDEPIGVTFQIRSMDSDPAKAVQRKIIDETYERRRANKTIKAKETVTNEYRKAAACIAGWDWGENEYNGSIPQYSEEKALEILTEQDWIFTQVLEAANKLSNFIVTSQET